MPDDLLAPGARAQLPDRALHGGKVAQEARREARGPLRSHRAPVGPGLRIERHLELVVALRRDLEMGRNGCGRSEAGPRGPGMADQVAVVETCSQGRAAHGVRTL